MSFLNSYAILIATVSFFIVFFSDAKHKLMRDWLENPGIPKVIYILSHFLTCCMNSFFQINQNCLINLILLEILEKLAN